VATFFQTSASFVLNLGGSSPGLQGGGRDRGVACCAAKMTTMAEKELALHIIREHFGIAVECVFDALAKRGRLSAYDLLQELPSQHFNPNTMFHILAILLQQNLLIAKRVAGTLLYSVDVAAALNRIRFPHFMKLVKDKFPPECEEIFRVLLLNGRLGAESVCRHAALKFEPSGREDPKCAAFVEKLNLTHRRFNEMLRAGFITRVEPLDDSTIYNIGKKKVRSASAAGAQKQATSSANSGNGSAAGAAKHSGSAASSPRSPSTRASESRGTASDRKRLKNGASGKRKKSRTDSPQVGFAALLGFVNGDKKKKKKREKSRKNAATGDEDSAPQKRARVENSTTDNDAEAQPEASKEVDRIPNAFIQPLAELKRSTFRCNIERCMQEMERQILRGKCDVGYAW